MIRNINIADFNYPLPEDRIALFPLPERDASKLLVWKNGLIKDSIFSSLADELPQNALLIFNDTKVIHARIVCYTPTGSRIEIFCLEPLSPVDIQLVFQERQSCVWKCFVGNNKRWKSGELSLEISPSVTVRIKRGQPIDNAWEVRFEWNGGQSFSEILDTIGKIPLPPYIHREVEDSDEDRYQTIFAKEEGSVAAPTASLHFTPQVLEKLAKKGITTDYLTLHVGAGTFKPVTTETIGEHKMHYERVTVSKSLVRNLITQLKNNRPVIPVGTTSLRSLESLFWLDESKKNDDHTYRIDQWDSYESDYSEQDVIERLEALPFENGLLQYSTALMIVPSYKFKIATGIVTNFHQPQSTLLLLVSALIGEKWRQIYDYALNHNYRFLSYGDSCLLIK